MERRGAGREADSVRPEQEAGGGGRAGGLAGGRLAWGPGRGSGPSKDPPSWVEGPGLKAAAYRAAFGRRQMKLSVEGKRWRHGRALREGLCMWLGHEEGGRASFTQGATLGGLPGFVAA